MTDGFSFRLWTGGNEANPPSRSPNVTLCRLRELSQKSEVPERVGLDHFRLRWDKDCASRQRAEAVAAFAGISASAFLRCCAALGVLEFERDPDGFMQRLRDAEKS